MTTYLDLTQAIPAVKLAAVQSCPMATTRAPAGLAAQHAQADQYHIVLVQNQNEQAGQIGAFLLDEGYRVSVAADGIAGLKLVRHDPPDLIILDADLPGIDGITLCGTIRAQSRTPIILLVPQANELQRVIGLDRGADLCLTRPVPTGELRARIRSLLRRAQRVSSPRRQPITIGDVRLDAQVRRAWLGERELQLTPREFELLAYLMQHCGVAVSRERLLKDVWGGRVDLSSQTLDVHIRWLRQKVEPDPDKPTYIRTVRMIGYRFEQPA